MSDQTEPIVVASDIETAWRELLRAHVGTAVHRRTSSKPDRHLFYALDTRARPGMLVIGPSIPPPRLPVLEALEFQLGQRTDGQMTLGIYLAESSYRPIFAQLFAVITNDLLAADTPGHQIVFVIDQIRNWQRLLERANLRTLSIAEQQGLWGELATLQKLLRTYPARAAVDAWRGPTHEAQDFRLEDMWLECKTIGSGAIEIPISNLQQLEIGPVPLYLVTNSIVEEPSGRSLQEQVAKVRAVLASDRAAATLFEALLAKAGYSDDHEYPARYSLARTRWYHVTEAFPRLAQSTVPGGVIGAEYQLRIRALSQFEQSEPTHDT